MREKSLLLTLILLLACVLPVSAAEAKSGSTPELSVMWLPETFDTLECYNRELNWLTLESDHYYDGNEEVLALIPYPYYYYVIDVSTGERVDSYNYVGEFSDGLAPVMRYGANGEKKWGYINEDKEEVIPLEYDLASDFMDGLAAVYRCDEIGPADCYGSIYDFSSGKYGFIDSAGKLVIPIEYDYVDGVDDGLIAVWKNGDRIGVFETPRQTEGEAPEGGHPGGGLSAGMAAVIALVAGAAGAALALMLGKRIPSPGSVASAAAEPAPAAADEKAETPPKEAQAVPEEEAAPAEEPEEPQPPAGAGPQYCSHCGSLLYPGALFCTECGKELTAR